MNTSTRPNFFLLLGLNPDAVWDHTVFEKALREKRLEWSRQSASVARKALIAKQNLALIPKIQEVMNSQAAREKEAKAAHKELAFARQNEYEQFEKQLAFINAKDAVEQEEVTRFVAAFQHLLTPEEIISRIQVRIGTPATYAKNTVRPLEPAIFKNITDRLHILHMSTLYELLKCSNKTATSELLRTTERLYTQLVRLPATAEVTAEIELTGLARDVFRSDEIRDRYDESLRLEAFNSLLKDLDDSMSHSTQKEIHPKQVALFLEQSRKAGWQEMEALERLKEHARLRKWTITIQIATDESQKIMCANCGHLDTAKQRYCARCQQLLYIECPACRREVSCEAVACSHCGFAVGNRYLVDHLLEDLARLIKKGDSEQTREILKELEQAWQPGTPDPRTQQIRAYQIAVQRLVNAQQQAHKEATERLRRLTISESMIASQRMVRISWEPPTVGSVVILQSMQPLQREGSVLPEVELDQLGKRLSGDEYSATDTWRTAEVVYYTPVVLFYEKGYIGYSQPFACLRDVQNLRYQNLGSVLRLRWTWPEDCQEALLTYSRRPWPEHYGPTATTYLLNRAEYEQQGYYDIHELANQDCYVLVSATVKQGDDSRLTSPGIGLKLHLINKAVVTYEIKKATILHKKGTLHLTIDAPTPIPTTLPVLLLVSKRGNIPMHKMDGEIFLRLERVPVGNKSIVLDLPNKPLPPKTFGKLFFENDLMYGECIIHHPSGEQMRLS